MRWRPGAANGAVTDITAGGFGTGAINLLGGVLFVRADADNLTTTRERINFSNAINVLGNAHIDLNRHGLTSAAGTNNNVRFASLSIGSQTLSVTGGNGYALEIAGGTTLTGNATLNVSGTSLVLRDVVSDGGGDHFIVKNGRSSLWLDAENTFSGGLYINAGIVEFGNIVAGNNTSNAGTGLITINPGAGIQLRSAANILPGQQIDMRSIPKRAGDVPDVLQCGQSDVDDHEHLLRSAPPPERLQHCARPRGDRRWRLPDGDLRQPHLHRRIVGRRRRRSLSPRGWWTGDQLQFVR
jgi:autotransporter-associated beta strand protein